MKTHVVGDVHRRFEQLQRLIEQFSSSDQILQIGDLGIGIDDKAIEFASNFKFIRGNHEWPEACQKHPNFKGDFGYDPESKIFYVSGARSSQTLVDWWPEEELSIPQINQVLDLYEKTKPDFIVSHDGPPAGVRKVLKPGKEIFPSRTSQMHQRLYEIHQPKVWVFGHHHFSMNSLVDNTRFICLNELEVITLHT